MEDNGVIVKEDGALVSCHVAVRPENHISFTGSVTPATTEAAVTQPGTSKETTKKRGRPRKYPADGPLAIALSPMPISSSIPLSREFSPWKQERARSADVVNKSHKYEFESIPGGKVEYFVGANFKPHVITVNAGEDVTMKVMSFSQQGAHAICILSANGTVSNVTLRQPTSSGGTLTHEGQFEILSLSGSFMPIKNGGTKSRSGGMSVSLAGSDGCVIGGGLAGLLVAASPVQVVVGSFLSGHQQEQKHKKTRTEPTVAVASPTALHTMSTEEIKVSYSGVMPILTSASFNGVGPGTLNPIRGFRNSAIDDKSSSAGEESKDNILSQGEFSG